MLSGGVWSPWSHRRLLSPETTDVLKPLFNENRKRPFPGWFSSVRNIEDNFSERRNFFFFLKLLYLWGKHISTRLMPLGLESLSSLHLPCPEQLDVP